MQFLAVWPMILRRAHFRGSSVVSIVRVCHSSTTFPAMWPVLILTNNDFDTVYTAILCLGSWW